MYLPRTSRTGPAQPAPCYGRFAGDASGATTGLPLGAARAGSVRRAVGLPGALTALVRDLRVLDEDLPETEHDSGVDVIITLPRSCRVARREAHAACIWATSTLPRSQPSRP